MTTQPASQTAPAADHPVAHFPKQAIVVVHGMGEQMPMDTIKAFVRAVWQTTTGLAIDLPNPTEVWSKPDVRTGSLELRRITTRQSIYTPAFGGGVRSDFYELYWADLSGGSTWSQVKDWIFGLLFRNPLTRVPPDVLLAWIVLWLIALVVAFVLLAAALPKEAHIGSLDLWTVPPLNWLQGAGWLVTALAAAFASFAASFIVPYFGRVVRYTVARPNNIAAREDIRKRGLDLLGELHRRDYDRIIVVGHSLGSILAYDLISYFWARREEQRKISEATDEFAALRRLEQAIAALAAYGDDGKPPAPVVEGYLAAQTEFGHLLRVRAKPAGDRPDARWLISDFITLGSPLSHAEFLMAKSKDDLKRRQQYREFPTSPPLRELLDPGYEARAMAAGFDIPKGHGQLLAFPFNPTQWQLHHACPFAATRWTNIYDPARLAAFGDLISGPVAPAFGHGIVDVDLRELRGQSWCFTHTHYWKLADDSSSASPPPHVRALREALDLLGQRRAL